MIEGFRFDFDVQSDHRVVDVVVISNTDIYTAARLSPDRTDAIARKLQDAAKAARQQPQPEPKVTP